MPTIQELEKEVTQEVERFKGLSGKRWEELKQKLSNLNKGEVKLMANKDSLNSLFDSSIKPLFTNILNQLREFEPEFLSSNYGWTGMNKNISSISDLEKEWKEGELLKSNAEVQFWFRLNGLKKAGANASDVALTLVFTTEPYWYSFKLWNYNDHQPFIKRRYDQSLSHADVQHVTNLLFSHVMDRIEFLIVTLDKN